MKLRIVKAGFDKWYTSLVGSIVDVEKIDNSFYAYNDDRYILASDCVPIDGPEVKPVDDIETLIAGIRGKKLYGDGDFMWSEELCIKELTAFIESKQVERWIPVTERLPENCKGVYVFGKNSEGMVRRAVAMYVGQFEYEAYDSDDSISEYDEKTDSFYVQAGWYEENTTAEINYALDFEVTHWQPLPKPPKDGV